MEREADRVIEREKEEEEEEEEVALLVSMAWTALGAAIWATMVGRTERRHRRGDGWVLAATVLRRPIRHLDHVHRRQRRTHHPHRPHLHQQRTPTALAVPANQGRKAEPGLGSTCPSRRLLTLEP